jgi:CRP-like cAMP-binding protein
VETRWLQIAASPSRRFQHGQVVLHQGERSESLYLVRDGAVRLCAVLPSGREVVVALLGAGDLFGESALAGPEPSPVEARTVGGVIVTAIPVPGLHAVLLRNPATAVEILRLLASRLHRTSATLQDALGRDLSARLCRSLCELARRHGVPDGGGVRVALPLTQEDLGRMVGATREAVNRTLVGLSRRGLVRTEERRYVIPDLAALEGLAGDAVA